MSRHKATIDPGFLIKHRIRCCGLDDAAASQLKAALEDLLWVDQVNVKAAGQTLIVAYDASNHSIDDVIAIVEQHGGSVSDHWWSQLRLQWQRQTDLNIHNNARHVPHCCSKSPKP